MLGVIAKGAAKILTKEAAGNMLASFLEPYIGDVKEAIANAARDRLESIITGRRTLDEWADIAIKGVDKIKDMKVGEGHLRFVGGKLKFTMSDKKTDKVVISFELYFLDENEKWQKVGADSDMYASNFTLEALDEIKTKKEVAYEVE